MLARRFTTLKMVSLIALPSLASIAGCPWCHHGDTTAPTVTSTDPANAATGVAINQIISAAFSEGMDSATITTATFTLTGPGASSVPATVAFDDTTNIATLTPSSTLAPDTAFSATIAGVTDRAGNALADAFVWSFTTGVAPDTTAPTVSSTTPADAATGVAINATIAATFSEAMDPSTITAAHFTLTGPAAASISGTVTYAAVGTTATFAPASTLASSTAYTATVTSGVADLAGNALASNKVWTFTTAAVPPITDVTAPTVSSTNPATAATGVEINKRINATFSEALDPGTITTATFMVTGPGLTPITGTVAYDVANHIATFTPTSNLAPDTTFTATITTGVKDLAGNALASNFVWSFTTGASAGQTAVPLGSVSTFAVLAGSAVTNTGATILNGDLGVSPSATVNGFPPGSVNGTIHAADPIAAQAKLDLTAAFLDAQGRSVGSQTLPGNLGGLTFTPGLYTNSTSVLISGSGPGNNVTLDAQGDANAVFIFQMGSTLTTGPGSQVILSGGAKASNVYWQVGTSATLDTTCVFKGNILAQTSITLNTGATLDGRALAQDGAVTLDNNTITTPAP